MSTHTYTHTYAVLEVSSEVYQEIKAKLITAGYVDQVLENGVIDMDGIGLKEANSFKGIFAHLKEKKRDG